MSDLTFCPSGQPCLREQEWGHPCDRDENGSRVESCERYDHEPCCTECNGTGVTPEGPCWDCRGTGHPHA